MQECVKHCCLGLPETSPLRSWDDLESVHGFSRAACNPGDVRRNTMVGDKSLENIHAIYDRNLQVRESLTDGKSAFLVDQNKWLHDIRALVQMKAGRTWSNSRLTTGISIDDVSFLELGPCAPSLCM